MKSQETTICTLLDKLQIKYELIHHPAVFTVAEADSIDKLQDGYGCKNLFLKCRNNSSYYLLIMCNEKHADLKNIRRQINSSSLTFASEEELFNKLKLIKGSVTPFGIINDLNHEVNIRIDKDIISKNKLGFHPNINTATVWISFDDLITFIKHTGNNFNIIEI